MAEVYITVDAANALLRSMVDAQIQAFGAQQRSIETLNAETQELVRQTREEVHRSLLANKESAEAHVVEQVGALRTQTQSSGNHVDSKLEEMRDLRTTGLRPSREARTRHLSSNLKRSLQMSRARSRGRMRK